MTSPTKTKQSHAEMDRAAFEVAANDFLRVHSCSRLGDVPTEFEELAWAMWQRSTDALRWQHAARCVRMDNFGGYVMHPDDPADFNGMVAERFTREIDAERTH